MAFPVVLINNSGGSDTQASGAGPSTALFGTTDASFSGATVTLTAGTDLTDVATDGSHVLYLLTSTGVRFFKITAKAGSGGATPTVDVTPSPAGTSTGRTWAIGGTRASLGSASSKMLVIQGASSAGDWKPGWVIELQSGHTETITGRLDLYGAGDTTDGPCTLRGEFGAATKPVITASGGGVDIVQRNIHQIMKDFTLTGVSGATNGVVLVGGYCRVERITMSGYSGTLIAGTGGAGAGTALIAGCDLDGGTIGLYVTANCRVIGNRVYDQTSHGIQAPSSVLSGLLIQSNIISGCGGDGITVAQTRTDGFAACIISGNTIDDCAGDGIEYSGDGTGIIGLSITNNLITANGGYGINFASLTATKVIARGALVSGNNTGSGATVNTSGACNLAGVLEGDPGLDPDYVGGGDYTPQEAGLEGTAYPTSIP